MVQEETVTSYILSKVGCGVQGGGAVLPYVTVPRPADSPCSDGDARVERPFRGDSFVGVANVCFESLTHVDATTIRRRCGLLAFIGGGAGVLGGPVEGVKGREK